MKKLYDFIKDKIKSNSAVFIVVLLIALFVVAYLFNSIVYTISSGEGGVLYRRFFGGTVVDKVYPEGIHFIFPWDRMYIYNVRVQEVPYEFDVLTKKGLRVQLRISIRYAPEYDLLGVLHQKVGPDYVNKVVIPEIESVLRVIIGQMDAEEVYTTKTAVIEKAINEAIEQVSQRFIKVDDVIIKRLQLPPSVEDAIRYKIEQKHLAEAYIFKIEREEREAERKRVEAGGIRDYNEIVQSSLSDKILYWKSIQASLELSKSQNSKVVVIGGGKNGLPIFGNIPIDFVSESELDRQEPSPSDESTDEPRTSVSETEKEPEREIESSSPERSVPADSEMPAEQSQETGSAETDTQRQREN
jgi:regulator of protease activity HflC (stomatin/prohibitin superfamily)